MAEEAAQIYGRYEVTGLLGKGGMARVYRAQDPSLKREVAVKVMVTAHSMFPAEAVERFQRELRALAKVEHPNIVRIFDAGEKDGTPYLVTELVEGEPLDVVIKKQGRQPPKRAVALIADLLEALVAVHDAGLVHRDIKPANLMLTGEGRLVLMDFGIARAAFADSLTRTGEVPGTLAYLPPECLAGQQASVSSDIFQVGLILYEALVGTPLFLLKNPKDFLMAHGDLPPKDLRERCEDAPEHLDRIVQKSLDPDPRKRYLSARSMLEELRSPAVAARRKPRSSVRVSAARPLRPSAANLQAAPAPTTAVWKLAGGTLGLAASILVFGMLARGAFVSAPPPPPATFDVVIAEGSMDVRWRSEASCRGAVEVTVEGAGSFVAEETIETLSHRVRIPGAFEGLPISVRVACSGGAWSTATAIGR